MAAPLSCDAHKAAPITNHCQDAGITARFIQRDDPTCYGSEMKAREDFKLATTVDGRLNQSGDRDKGWTLEVAIPWENFSGIGPRPKPGTEPNRRLGIWSDSALESPFPHNPARCGTVRFIG